MDILTSNELAQRWHTTPGALANQRMRDKGPRYRLIGRTVIYERKEVERHERENPGVLQKKRRMRKRVRAVL